MVNMKYNSWLVAALIVVSFMACGQQEQVTDSGITYKYINKGSGNTPAPGGVWELNAAYFNHVGDTMFSTAQQGGPVVTQYMAPYPANGGLEECFNFVGEGDSAVFMVPADSLYKHTAGRMAPPDLVGTMIEVRLGVEAIYSMEEYTAKMEEKGKVRIEEEVALIEAYIAENNIDAEITEEGLYYQILEPGNGKKPESGQRVKVAYKGYILDGTVFDTSIEEEAKAAGTYNPGRPYEPYEFTLTTGSVIQGWHIGIAQLTEGAKAKLIIPSRYGYGPRGSGQVITPNSVLIFDVELAEIVEDEGN